MKNILLRFLLRFLTAFGLTTILVQVPMLFMHPKYHGCVQYAAILVGIGFSMFGALGFRATKGG